MNWQVGISQSGGTILATQEKQDRIIANLLMIIPHLKKISWFSQVFIFFCHEMNWQVGIPQSGAPNVVAQEEKDRDIANLLFSAPAADELEQLADNAGIDDPFLQPVAKNIYNHKEHESFEIADIADKMDTNDFAGKIENEPLSDGLATDKQISEYEDVRPDILNAPADADILEPVGHSDSAPLEYSEIDQQQQQNQPDLVKSGQPSGLSVEQETLMSGLTEMDQFSPDGTSHN